MRIVGKPWLSGQQVWAGEARLCLLYWPRLCSSAAAQAILCLPPHHTEPSIIITEGVGAQFGLRKLVESPVTSPRKTETQGSSCSELDKPPAVYTAKPLLRERRFPHRCGETIPWQRGEIFGNVSSWRWEGEEQEEDGMDQE
ncbi:hypothetical protein SKAU_G00401280 [Synaphobranchus kaupii]|uniref:Uncharacterized protein n=1 Tax=Synaphobranchus kaupii TaxID=118154 RepID=A0A9Q1E927_SYNKA|nr:hypothetical protein SKAU_G00401280 [Synaphobranchus kaupii]